MLVQNWASIKKEVMSDKLSRRVVTGEKLMAAEITIAKGGLVPTHQHENEQISYCVEGKIRLIVNGETFDLGPGDTLVIPSNIPHSAEALEDSRTFDLFSPIRRDWLAGDDAYLRK